MSSTTIYPQPKVVIDRYALEKIHFLVAEDSQEISGMGLARVVGDTVYIDDVKMLPQKNGATHTDIDAEAVAKLMYEWRARDGNVIVWWHSHVNMSVFWSTTDRDTIEQMAKQGMCVAMVFNKRREIRTAVGCRIAVPFVEGEKIVLYDDIPLLCETYIPDDVKAAWKAELEENVIKTPALPALTNWNWRKGRYADDEHEGGGLLLDNPQGADKEYIEYAFANLEVEDYDPKTEKFLLFTGAWISASFYLSDGGERFRESLKRRYQNQAELDKDMRAYAREHHVDTPTEADLEAMYASNGGLSD